MRQFKNIKLFIIMAISIIAMSCNQSNAQTNEGGGLDDNLHTYAVTGITFDMPYGEDIAESATGIFTISKDLSAFGFTFDSQNYEASSEIYSSIYISDAESEHSHFIFGRAFDLNGNVYDWSARINKEKNKINLFSITMDEWDYSFKLILE